MNNCRMVEIRVSWEGIGDKSMFKNRVVNNVVRGLDVSE